MAELTQDQHVTALTHSSPIEGWTREEDMKTLEIAPLPNSVDIDQYDHAAHHGAASIFFDADPEPQSFAPVAPPTAPPPTAPPPTAPSTHVRAPVRAPPQSRAAPFVPYAAPPPAPPCFRGGARVTPAYLRGLTLHQAEQIRQETARQNAVKMVQLNQVLHQRMNWFESLRRQPGVTSRELNACRRQVNQVMDQIQAAKTEHDNQDAEIAQYCEMSRLRSPGLVKQQ